MAAVAAETSPYQGNRHGWSAVGVRVVALSAWDVARMSVVRAEIMVAGMPLEAD